MKYLFNRKREDEGKMNIIILLINLVTLFIVMSLWDYFMITSNKKISIIKVLSEVVIFLTIFNVFASIKELYFNAPPNSIGLVVSVAILITWVAILNTTAFKDNVYATSIFTAFLKKNIRKVVRAAGIIFLFAVALIFIMEKQTGEILVGFEYFNRLWELLEKLFYLVFVVIITYRLITKVILSWEIMFMGDYSWVDEKEVVLIYPRKQEISSLERTSKAYSADDLKSEPPKCLWKYDKEQYSYTTSCGHILMDTGENKDESIFLIESCPWCQKRFEITVEKKESE